jgi:hypothetical protein
MPSNFRKLFEELLEIVDRQRPGYRASLGSGMERAAVASILVKSEDYPCLVDIYSLVCGTPREIRDQSLFDLIPGYRLLQINEVAAKRKWENREMVPLLENYSSDYIAFSGGSHCLLRLSHDDSTLFKVYDNPDTFLQSLIEFYRSGAYFLDSDGYLDSDLKNVSKIGRRLNPESNYWVLKEW